ncbi:LamG domain-containing protein, partial [archaeon]
STWVSGSNCKYGSCVNFTGNNYALLGTDVWDDSTFQSGGSQEAWIKINKFPAGGADYYSAFISIEGRIDFNIHDSQRLRFYVGGVNHFSTSTLQTGTWYHVVATYDAAKTVRIYINGQLDNTTSYTTWNDIDSVSRIDTIGGHYSLANFFNGTMDEVRIYNRPLSSQEVWEHYSKDVSRYYDDFNVGAKRNYGVEDSNTILQPISPNSTILHLRFNDNSTINATDSSGYGNGGGTFGGATWITNSSCKSSFEGCVAFDGSTDDILVPNSTSLAFSSTSPFTVSTWIYPRAFVDRDMIFNLENGVSGQFNFWFALLSTSKVRMSLQNGSTTQVADSLSALQTNNWYHLAATYDGSIVSIYLNGALDSSTSITSFAGTATNSPLYIGRRNPAVGSFFLNALTDEMIMINRSLSSSEINQLYLGGYNRTINGYGHRIASADSVSTIAYNLTDHDVVTQQDYDQRMLLINGTQATAFNATQVLTGSTKALNMTLQYDKITLTGTMSIQSGNYKICVQNTGVSGGKTVVNIGLC